MNPIIGWKAVLATLSTITAIVTAIVLQFDPLVVVNPPTDPAFGAVSGNEIQGKEIIVGGAKLWIDSQDFANVASTTLCSFKLPNATTTPVKVSAKLVANSGGTDLIIGESITGTNALTNVIARRKGGAAGFTGDLTSTSTPGLFTATNYGTFSPGANINVGLTSATTATGTCRIMLQVL